VGTLETAIAADKMAGKGAPAGAPVRDPVVRDVFGCE
jgi:hypothetical protein